MRRLALLGALLAVAATGCSKTEDTAPETRIFGSPPVISNVEFTGGQETANCDLSRYAHSFMCNVVAGTAPSDWVFQDPPVRLEVGYSSMEFRVSVTDPETTPTQTDILLVGSSYVHGGEETTLLVFDDGSTLDFPMLQIGFEPQSCPALPTDPVCQLCTPATYILHSNDQVANDGVFSRGYAFVGLQGSPGVLGNNCVADVTDRAPVSLTGLEGQTLEFKIEAVDRSGNITTWPAKPSITLQASTFDCLGDPCLCCLVTSGNPTADPPEGCRDLPGTSSPLYAPGGFCIDFL